MATGYDNKIKSIETAIFEEASEKANALRREADNFKAKELEAAENEVTGELYNQIQEAVSAIRASSAEGASRLEFESHKKLLQKRNEYCESIFSAVYSRMLAFSDSPDYAPYLTKRCADFAKANKTEGGKVSIRAKDASLKDELIKLMPGVTFEIDSRIKLGGFIFEDAKGGLMADETLEAALEEGKAWFYANANFSVT